VKKILILALLFYGCGGRAVDSMEQQCKVLEKVCLCHIPPGNPDNAHTICVSKNAVAAHLAHGDTLGPCTDGPGDLPDAGTDAGSSQDTPDAGVIVTPDSSVDGGGSDEPLPQDAGVIQETRDSGEGIPTTRGPNGSVPNPDNPILDNSDLGNTDDTIAIAGGCNASGSPLNPGNFIWILLMLGWAVAMFRKKFQLAMILAILGIITLLAGRASAFPTQNYKPAVGTFDYFTTEDGRITLPTVGLQYQYEYRPVRLITKPGNETMGSIISSRHVGHLTGAIGAPDIISVGLDLPIVLYQDARPSYYLGTDGDNGGIGDLRLLFKAVLFKHKSLRTGLGVNFELPTSTVDSSKVTGAAVDLKAIVSGTLGPVDLALNAGIRLTGDKDANSQLLQKLDTGKGFIASGAARWWFYRSGDRAIALTSDLYGSGSFQMDTWEEAPVEWLNGLQANLGRLSLTAGVGVGLTRGMRVPVARALAGISWRFGGDCKIVNKTTILTQPLPLPEQVPVPVLVPVPVIVVHPIYFPFDSAELTLEAEARLHKILGLIKEHPELKYIHLKAHTDVRGTEKYNEDLAKRRMDAVGNWLAVGSIAADITDLTIGGRSYGETKPAVKDAKSELEHALNRRVEVIIKTREE